MAEPPTDVTEILLQARGGAPGATDRLLAALYSDLRGMADRFLRHERADHTLQPTELVHEAYFRLVDQTRCAWQDRAHFLAIASQAMRRILVDHARRRGSAKRGGGVPRIPLHEATNLIGGGDDTTLLALDFALDKLAAVHPDSARVVELRFFGGLTHEECAGVLDVSPRTVSRHWEFARAWLYREMSGDAPGY
ncbi:MAG: sigma-70 family RNA polymerase sigma factor [bacterium]